MVAAAALVAGFGGGSRSAGRPTAGPAVFTSVTCRGDSFCLATGTYPKPKHPQLALLEEWNGRAWRIFPKPGGYNGITCGGPPFCLAGVELHRKSSTLVWDGQVWRTLKYQPPPGYGLTCESPTFCVLPDPSVPQVVELSSTGWQGMPGSSDGCGGPDCVFDAFICETATDCRLSGEFCTDDDCDGDQSFIQLWNGVSWNLVYNLPPFQPTMACAGRSFCLQFNNSGSTTAATASISRDWRMSWHDASAGLAAACHRGGGCQHSWALACGSAWSCLVLTSASAFRPPVSALNWNGATWTTARLAQIGGQVPARYRAAIDAGGDPEEVGTWIAQARPSASRPKPTCAKPLPLLASP